MLYDLIYKMTLVMRKSKIGKKLYEVVYYAGGILLNTFEIQKNNKRNFKKPTDAMRKSKEFFTQNIDRVEAVTNMLYDDESKNVFRGMVDFRMTSNYKEHPKYNFLSQYFDNDFFDYKDGEVLVDCGAFDGNSITSFKRQMKKRNITYKKLIAFEADSKNAGLLKENIEDNCLVLVNAGVWSKDGTLNFITRGDGSSMVVDANDLDVEQYGNHISIPVKAIDNVRECDDATLIKMDIEGSELEALRGAKELISKKRPKLAICIYHSDEDMLRIAEYIHELVPEYKLFVRQHTNGVNETVLYATL